VLCFTNQDELTTTTTTAAAAATAAAVPMSSRNLLSPYDVTCCYGNPPSQQLSLAGNESMNCDSGCDMSATYPVITLNDSELADVGESFFTAELPPPSDWSPLIRSSSSPANHNSDGLLTLQSLDMVNNCIKLDPSLNSQVLEDSHLTDDTAASDDSVTGDLMRAGTQLTLIISY